MIIDLFESFIILLNVYFSPVYLCNSTKGHVYQSPESQPIYEFLLPWVENPTRTTLMISIGGFLTVVLFGVIKKKPLYNLFNTVSDFCLIHSRNNIFK